MLSIIYNNKDSYDDFALIMERLPSLPCSKAEYETIDIEGRDGTLNIFKNYSDGELKIDFEIKDKDFEANKNSMLSWLLGEESNKELLVSEDISLFYKVKQVSVGEIKHEGRLRKFTVTFRIAPFTYLVDGKRTREITNGSVVLNGGTHKSTPRLKIYGSGSVTITINNKSFTLKNIDGYVVIDSELHQVYKDNINKGKDMTGEFPVFFSGQNNVSWTGAISKIEATPNWRCY